VEERRSVPATTGVPSCQLEEDQARDMAAEGVTGGDDPSRRLVFAEREAYEWRVER